jgi:hypothetical protein
MRHSPDATSPYAICPYAICPDANQPGCDLKTAVDSNENTFSAEDTFLPSFKFI